VFLNQVVDTGALKAIFGRTRLAEAGYKLAFMVKAYRYRALMLQGKAEVGKDTQAPALYFCTHLTSLFLCLTWQSMILVRWIINTKSYFFLQGFDT
jgi:hypothetical protein